MLDANFLEYLNGPWSNAACVGYCYKAMLRAGASPDMSCSPKARRVF